VIGSTAISLIGQFKVDYAIIGASAIDEEGALPGQPELAAGQLVQWMIAPTAVRLPSLKPQPHYLDNPVSGRIELRLNLGAHFQVALHCGTERLWLSAERNLEPHHGLETDCEITVDLRSDALVCWQHPDRV
jgi:molybdate/tungstate transport system ATP-binding protein